MAADGGTDGGFVAPAGPDQQALAELWRQVLGVPRVGANDNFFDLGGHSLLAIQLVERAHQAGLELSVDDLFRRPRLGEMAGAMRARLARPAGGDDWSSLVRLRDGDPSKPPLFFLHLATGDLLVYASVVHHLPADQPCYGFQSLGLLHPERSHPTIEAMAAHYVRLLRDIHPAGPVLLAGWCFGGNLAQEMAVQLRAAGRPVALLALMSCWAHPPVRGAWRHAADRLAMLLRMGPREWLHFLRRRRVVREKLRGWTLKEELKVEVTGGVLARRETCYRLNSLANKTHRTTYDPGVVTLFRPAVPEEDRIPDPWLGWRRLAGRVEAVTVPGTHAGMMQEPDARALAAALADAIRGGTEDGRRKTEDRRD